MKRLLFAVLLIGLGTCSYAAPIAHLHPQIHLPRIFAQVTGGHTAVSTWTLSVDDTTTACTTTANCMQNVYRASGACSTTSTFTLLTTTALGPTVTTYTDTTITPGIWCYGVTFVINGLESSKDTASVTLQPASPTGEAVTGH